MISRRQFLSQSALSALALGLLPAKASANARQFGLVANGKADQTNAFLSALSQARGAELKLENGVYRLSQLTFPHGAKISGSGKTELVFNEGGISAQNIGDISFKNLRLRFENPPEIGAITLQSVAGYHLQNLEILGDLEVGLRLIGSSGICDKNKVSGARAAGIFSQDGVNSRITDNTVLNSDNNAILVWQSEPRFDGTVISGNTIDGVKAKDGGNGQNGNGINLFRAHGCVVENNTIKNCVFSAIRLNNASDAQILKNIIDTTEEVAIFVEFGARNVVLRGNKLKNVVSGISFTNADHGGGGGIIEENELAGVGLRPSINPDITQPFGIFAERDTLIQNNRLQNGPDATGIGLGWGPYCEGLIASNNEISDFERGFDVSIADGAQKAFILDNRLSNISGQAIAGTAWHDISPEDLLDTGHKLHILSGNQRL